MKSEIREFEEDYRLFTEAHRRLYETFREFHDRLRRKDFDDAPSALLAGTIKEHFDGLLTRKKKLSHCGLDIQKVLEALASADDGKLLCPIDWLAKYHRTALEQIEDCQTALAVWLAVVGNALPHTRQHIPALKWTYHQELKPYRERCQLMAAALDRYTTHVRIRYQLTKPLDKLAYLFEAVTVQLNKELIQLNKELIQLKDRTIKGMKRNADIGKKVISQNRANAPKGGKATAHHTHPEIESIFAEFKKDHPDDSLWDACVKLVRPEKPLCRRIDADGKGRGYKKPDGAHKAFTRMAQSMHGVLAQEHYDTL